jgi:hypothetical protein
MCGERKARRSDTGRTTIPRFFFNLCTNDGVERDEEGVELPDIETAYLEAFYTASEMWIESIRHRRDPSHHRFEITDTHGSALLSVPFTEVLGAGAAGRARSTAPAPVDRRRDRQPVPTRPTNLDSRFDLLHERTAHTRSLGATVMDQITIARQRLEESRELLAQLGAARH